MALYDNGLIITFEDNTSILEQPEEQRVISSYIRHTIKQGDTLFSISRKYYQNTSRWYDIANVNDLIDPIVLTVGDILIIPFYG